MTGPTYTPAKFQASTSDWGAFIIWKVDIAARQHEHNAAVPPEPDWPAPPPMAISCTPAVPAPMCVILEHCLRSTFVGQR
jgi:hypothetical protein